MRLAARTGRFARALLAPLAAGLMVWAAALWVVHGAQARFTVRADLELTGGRFVELFLNDASEPLRTPVLPRRRTYEFSRALAGIDALRLRPTDAVDVIVHWYGLDIVGPGGDVIARYGPDEVRRWTMHDLALVEASPDAITLRTTGPDPAIVAALPAEGVSLPRGRTALIRRLEREPWLPYFLLVPLVLLVEIRPAGRWLLRTALAGAVLAAWPAIHNVVFSMGWGPTVSHVAISRAAYEGISLPSMQAAVAAGFAAAGFAGLVVAFWPRWRVPAGIEEPAVAPLWFFGLAAGLILVLTAPDLSWLLAWMESVPYSPHWDSNNILYWAYWTAHGQLPLRDFWYPYGGLFLFQEPWPVGPLINWAADAGRYLVLSSALMLASGRRWSVLLVVAAVHLAETSGLNFAVARYLLAANVVLAYAAASRWQFAGWPPRTTLAIALIMPLVLEPAQLMYAVPAVAAMALVDAWKHRRPNVLWRGPAFCAATLGLAAIPLVLLLWAAGMLAGTWLFYQRLGDTAQYAAFPAPIDSPPWPDFQLSSIVLWTPAVALAIALAELRRSDPGAVRRALALVGLAVLDFMVLQKHLIRMMPDTLMFCAYLFGLVFAVLAPAGPRGAARVGLGAVLGLLAAMLLIQGRWDREIAVAARLPARVVQTSRALLTPAVWARANAARFSRERFSAYTEQRALVDALSRRRSGPLQLFSLTDDPVLYLLTGQPPAWHVNLYNGSPVYEQRRIIDDLNADPPDYVVARRGRLAFDGMPLGVRVPDVLAFVMTRYAPDADVEAWAVLRPRQSGEPVDVTFWRDLLGDTLDLGMLPARLAERERRPCVPDLACDELLVLDVPGPGTGAASDVRLDAGGTVLTVRVRLTSGQRHYVIPLSRLWPAVAARESGLPLVAMPAAPATLQWMAAARPSGALY